MSVGKRIGQTIARMEAGDPEDALFQISAAIATTAKAEYQAETRENRYFKLFLHDNFGLITDIAFERKILNLNVSFDHPDLHKNANGLVPVENILYHVVRCGHYHDSKFPDNLKFIPERIISCKSDGTLLLPASLIYGLITAVVVSPVNAGQDTGAPSVLNFGDFPVPLSRLWGKRTELLWLLDAVLEAKRLAQELEAAAVAQSTSCLTS